MLDLLSQQHRIKPFVSSFIQHKKKSRIVSLNGARSKGNRDKISNEEKYQDPSVHPDF